MDYMPIDAATRANDVILSDATEGPWVSFPGRRPLGGVEVLRYRGVMMNATTGAIAIRGRLVTLSVAERELLAALMRRAGQIVSPSWLAQQLHATTAEVEERATTLQATLREAGSATLPRKVDGLGYILWP